MAPEWMRGFAPDNAKVQRIGQTRVAMCKSAALRWEGPPNGLEMSRPASQAQYRAETDNWLAGSAPSSC